MTEAITPQLVVGLGNPGPAYASTRHNIGFWWVDRLAAQLGLTFANEPRFFGEVARSGSLRLLKPTTFMNRSGQAVAALARFFRIPPEAILVVHDELDLPPGRARLKFGGGVAGHNGLKDLCTQLGTERFWRLRLGIGHPGHRNEVAHYVLNAPSLPERQVLDQVVALTLTAWPSIAQGDWAAAQRTVNGVALNSPAEESHL